MGRGHTFPIERLTAELAGKLTIINYIQQRTHHLLSFFSCKHGFPFLNGFRRQRKSQYTKEFHGNRTIEKNESLYRGNFFCSEQPQGVFCCITPDPAECCLIQKPAPLVVVAHLAFGAVFCYYSNMCRAAGRAVAGINSS